MVGVSTEDSYRNDVYSYAHRTYLSNKRWVFCCWNPPWWFLYFPTPLVNSKKQQKASFHTVYDTVLCEKNLILACAYLGFFPVIFTTQITSKNNQNYCFLLLTMAVWKYTTMVSPPTSTCTAYQNLLGSIVE